MVAESVDRGKRKSHGAVYTPRFIVEIILDAAGYRSGVRQRHVIDNSCGDGAFLEEVVRRYCLDFPARGRKAALVDELSRYVHGLDTDADAVRACRVRLDGVAAEFGARDVPWDVREGSALEETRYSGLMDFVVGNPPYVRVHNLQASYAAVKGFTFAQRGMTDLYLVFLELGLRMLTDDGVMCLITPSSFLRSVAGGSLRRYIEQRRTLSSVIDLEHFQVFNATTYTMISVFQPGRPHDAISYYTLSDAEHGPMFIEDLGYGDVFIEGKMYFSPSEQLHHLREIEDSFASRLTRTIKVKNGFATLADRIFIGHLPFENGTIPVVKASTGEWARCIYPYDPQGRGLSLEAMSRFPEAMRVLERHRDTLMQRDADGGAWHLFGRSQGILDVAKDKVAVSSLVRKCGDTKVNASRAGTGVYGGLYVLGTSESDLRKAMADSRFIDYIKLLKNYKSGGYYAFSSGDLERYLAHVLERGAHQQQRIPRGGR